MLAAGAIHISLQIRTTRYQRALESHFKKNLDSKVHGANMGPTWVRQDPGWPHVGPMNIAVWEVLLHVCLC